MEQQTTETNVLRTLSNQMADAVEHVQSSIVLVNGREKQPATGIIYTPEFIITASHVLERNSNITVQTHDKRTLSAQLVGRDPSTDLAVLRVSEFGEVAPASQEKARVGQLVMAIGRSSSDSVMASVGIVSSIGGPLRTNRGIALERFIRTDAIPYPGFSGGALIDTQGAVVGILTTGLGDNVAYAIPMDIVKTIADTIAKQGTIKRGYLGISSQFVQVPVAQRAGRTQEHGLLIVNVEKDSPAQKGGVMLGDILIALDSHIIRDAEDLQLLLTGERVGKTIPVEVIRGNAVTTLQITIGQRN